MTFLSGTFEGMLASDGFKKVLPWPNVYFFIQIHWNLMTSPWVYHIFQSEVVKHLYNN